jgi:tetratricopeptide (TPR) repeat protein
VPGAGPAGRDRRRFPPLAGEEVEMIVQTAENSFRKGLAALKTGQTLEAMAYFEAAIVRDRATNREHPTMKYQSYFGFCLAHTTKQRKEATKLCRDAAESEFYNPDLFLNLGRVALLNGNRRDAFRAFRRGLALDPAHKELGFELRRLGLRRRPVFRFLGRGHPFNRFVGQLRQQLLG